MKRKLARAATRHWLQRAVTFLKTNKRFGPDQARKYREQFRRHELFQRALDMVQSGGALVTW